MHISILWLRSLLVYNGYYGLAKWDSLLHSSVCSIYTLSCCSHEQYTYAITCVYVEAGVIPGQPLTL